MSKIDYFYAGEFFEYFTKLWMFDNFDIFSSYFHSKILPSYKKTEKLMTENLIKNYRFS